MYQCRLKGNHQTSTIQGKKGEGPTALTVYDVMGLGEEQDSDEIFTVVIGHKASEEALVGVRARAALNQRINHQTSINWYRADLTKIKGGEWTGRTEKQGME